MARKAQGSDAQVDGAVRAAVAQLIGVDAADVRVAIEAPGLDELVGAFHVELRSDPATDDDTDAPNGANDRTREPAESVAVTAEELDEEADAAADFIEGLLDALDLPGDLRIRVLEDHAEVEIAEMGSGTLIGRRGQTLDAVQELVRCALQRRFERRAHVLIDAEGYRARRLEKLTEKANEAIDEVLDTGEPVRLEPMDVFERKAVHQIVAGVDGVTSRSHGREPSRRVVIELGDDD